MLVALLSRLIYLLAKCLEISYRFRFIGHENIYRVQQESPHNNYIFALWHQNLFASILAQKKNPHAVMVSRSKDAEPINFTLNKFSHVTARGSSTNKAGVNKGGKLAKKEIIELLKSGLPGAITVDGPKGPAKEVKPGIIDMAKQSGHGIIPYAAIPKSYWQFNSWDKIRLPKPFSQIIVIYGKPIFIKKDLEYENFLGPMEQIKESLNQAQLDAEKILARDFRSQSNLNYTESPKI